MPPVQAGYLLSYFMELGPMSGEQPISQGEIRAWQENVGIELKSWECRFLRSLSREYLIESRKAQQHNAPSPWKPEAFRFSAFDTKAAIRALANS